MSRRLREICIPSQIRRITQGTVFSDAVCSDSSYSKVVGIVISARCDIQNSKDESFAYLPAVPLIQWIDRACIPKLVSEMVAQKKKQYLDAVAKIPSIAPMIGVFGVEKIHEIVCKNPPGKEFADLSKIYGDIAGVDSLSTLSYSSLDESNRTQKGLKASINKEVDKCAKNQIGGYFLIDQMVDYALKDKLASYVVNLREVRYLPAWLGNELAAGFHHDAHFGLAEVASCIRLSEGGFSYALCEIKSPYIELLMQRFTGLFSRIGVEDPVVDEILLSVR